MKKTISLLLALICLLAACAPPAEQIQKAIEETQAAAQTLTPRSMVSILESYGFTEKTELEAGCNCSVFRNAPTTTGATEITVHNQGAFVISAPIDLNALASMLGEVFGEDVRTWIIDNSKPPEKGNELGLYYYTGYAGNYNIEIDFDTFSPHSLEMIEIKAIQ